MASGRLGPMRYLLGIDVGTTSVKAGLFDESGRSVSSAIEEYPLDHPRPDWVQIDAEVYWRSAERAVRRVLDGGRVAGHSVVAVGTSSQGETVIPVDGNGDPVGPAIVWLDNRASEESREIAERFGESAIYEATGVPSVFPTWTACKILWLNRHEPGVAGATRHYLLVEDFILHRLTGRFVADGGAHSTSLLYDIRGHCWWEPMLELLDLRPAQLPELVVPGEIVGTVRPSVAESWGLSDTTLVVAGGADQGAGAVGAGNISVGSVSESTGGSLAVQATAPGDNLRPTGLLPVYVHSAPGQYLYVPVCPTAGLALTWFRDHFGRPGTTDEGAGSFDGLIEQADRVPPGSDGLTMLPHLMGAFTPEYEPAARGAFYGFTLHHGKGHFVRAILESVAFMLRRNLELLASAGVETPEIRSHGRGARSRTWNQIKADVCGVAVVTLQGDEAAPRGDAMVAGVASGAFADLTAASRAMVKARDRYEPSAPTRDTYDAGYWRYIELFDAMAPLRRQDDKSTTPKRFGPGRPKEAANARANRSRPQGR